jgi:hypothetical protein
MNSTKRQNLVVLVSVVVVFTALILLYAGVSANGYNQNPVTPVEQENTYYVPYVANSWWKATPDVDWYIANMYTIDGDLYADFAMNDGWLVRGKALQLPGPLWQMPSVGMVSYWNGYYFFPPSTSWHPPFYIQFAAQEVLVQPASVSPDPAPEVEYVYQLPYVAKSWWGVRDREWFTIDTWSEKGVYYATLQDIEGGFLILGKSWHYPDNIQWVACGPGGSNYWWLGYEFMWFNGSGHRPYCLYYAAQEILSWPPAYATPAPTP